MAYGGVRACGVSCLVSALRVDEFAFGILG